MYVLKYVYDSVTPQEEHHNFSEDDSLQSKYLVAKKKIDFYQDKAPNAAIKNI